MVHPTSYFVNFKVEAIVDTSDALSTNRRSFKFNCETGFNFIVEMKIDLTKWDVFRGKRKNCSIKRRAFLDQVKRAHVIHLSHYDDHDFSALVVTHDDDVFAIGEDCFELLGKTGENDLNEPRKIDALCQRKIKEFAYHVKSVEPLNSTLCFVALSEYGQLFTWGYNCYGQLGNGSKKSSSIPMVLEGELTNRKVVQFGCSSGFMVALTEQGEVFFWDVNRSNDRISEWPEKVTQNFDDRKAVAVACSAEWSYALLEDGQLYSWGNNRDGQLGIGNEVQQSDPFPVDGFEEKTIIKQMVCSFTSCMVLTDCGQIFAWGYICNNADGEDDYSYPVVLPERILSKFGRAVQIRALDDNCAVMFDDGTTFLWNDQFFVKWKGLRPVDCSTIDEVCPGGTWRTLDLSTVDTTLGFTLDDEHTTDICFRVGKKRIWAHKQMLMQSCGYFDAMFQSHWIESKKQEFEISHFTYHTFFSFLHYIYTEQLRPYTRWTELSALADYYGLPNLQSRCLSKIRCQRHSHKRRHCRGKERDFRRNKCPKITENEQPHHRKVELELSEAASVQHNMNPATLRFVQLRNPIG